ncbi:MAG TPA: patatin-like phospholipase family protein [Telluria sp.]
MTAAYTSSQAADIQRKLASIADQFSGPLPEDIAQFLAGPTTCADSALLRSALARFNAEFCKYHEDEPDYDEQVWRALDAVAGSVQNEVWQFELDGIKLRKPPAGVRPADEATVISAAHRAELAGLAFSGGGIRSATFNLGILQALAANRLLRDFDYLSTVSGGGYIGSWLSRWLNKENDIAMVESKLAPKPETPGAVHEAAQITFLRQHSNFLTPKTGMFSADTWSMLSIYVRNTMLNLTMLVALLAVAMMVPRLLVALVAWLGPGFKTQFAVLGWAAALWSVFCIALSISIKPSKGARDWLRGQSQGNVIAFVVIPLMLAGFAGSIAIWYGKASLLPIWAHLGSFDSFHPAWLFFPGTLYFAAWACGWTGAQVINAGSWRGADWSAARRQWAGHFGCAAAAYAIGTLLVLATLKGAQRLAMFDDAEYGSGMPVHLVALGMPILLSLFGITMILCIGLVGRMYSEASREWWARQGAWTIILSLAWLGLCCMSLYGPPLVDYLMASAGGWGSKIMASTWVGATIAGLLLGRGDATGKRDRKPYFGLIATLAPGVFAAGLMLLVSAFSFRATLALSPAANRPIESGIMDAYYANTDFIPAHITISTLVLLLVGGYLLARRVDINKFSLYMMYRNRLTRAFLGAHNKGRTPHPFTGFDENDDVLLSQMLANRAGHMQRPFHIINTTLNMVSGTELAWQTRRASGFAFTPAFCGFELPAMPTPNGRTAPCEAARGCYRRTRDYDTEGELTGDDDGGIKLGMAMAVSGAAVSPNMGYHSAPALAFLLTLFNVRLGRWFANPLWRHWKKRSPEFGMAPLLSEMFGMSDSGAHYLSLSDGGHFENLGIYELVRRRCRLIVVVDAGADGNLQFDDLGNAIRKCATDLNIQIDIDVSKVDLVKAGDFSTAHYATGKIRYSQTDKLEPGAHPNDKVVDGTLFYIKPSLLGTEPADVLNYRKSNKDFPHQTTGDQWFDETQFESYRALGYRIGSLAFRQAAEAVVPAGKENRISDICAIFEGIFGNGAPARHHLHVVPKRPGSRRQN